MITAADTIRAWFRRQWHVLWGHPGHLVTWGSFTDGASCICGERWWLNDLYP